MPGSGFNSTNMKLARRMLEYCRFAYKAYAQTCSYPMDPFYEAHAAGDSARERLALALHQRAGTQGDAQKFDPIAYDLRTVPNPHQGVVYRGGEDTKYILFAPRPLDLSISEVKGFDLAGNALASPPTLTGATGSVRCAYFQGRTGMTQTHPTSGWTSWLGAVLYDPQTQNCVIVYRGSRSGKGGRALSQAQFHSKGSPDWVTDMNHLKGVDVPKYRGATLSCGFQYAYASSQASLRAAYTAVTSGATPKAVYVTGHSLGGALAQCAYLDLTCGDLQTLFASQSGAATAVRCFALAAPPVVLGRAAHQKIALDADATQVFHYFCPGDLVHSSPLVDTSKSAKTAALSAGNAFLKAFSHPATDPFHIGAEIALESDAGFPDAHEPEEIWKGMNAGTSDAEFWPTVTLSLNATQGWLVGLPSSLRAQARAALRASNSAGRGGARAMDWHAAAQNPPAQLTADALKLEGIVANLHNSRARLMADSVAAYRSDLLKGFASAPGKASRAAYWTLLQALTTEQVIAELA